MKTKKMDRPVTVHEMESMAIGLDGPDFTKELGNVIDIPDANDSLGFGMLANPGKQRGNNTFTVPEPTNTASSGLAEVEIGSLDTLEPITLNIGGGGISAAQPIEIQFSKAEEEKTGGGLFSNMQTYGAWIQFICRTHSTHGS
jgi:hypothetical protein